VLTAVHLTATRSTVTQTFTCDATRAVSPAPFHLAWFPASDRWDLELQMAIKTQFETPFPMMLVPFTFAGLEVFLGAAVRSRCQDVFAYATDTGRLLQKLADDRRR
jgi:hypothetical protein